jgi:hypothetical protein
MADDGAKLLTKFIEPLRVEPGSKVKLASDFDPGYKASFLKKKDAAAVLNAGVSVLAEAAQADEEDQGRAGRGGAAQAVSVPQVTRCEDKSNGDR